MKILKNKKFKLFITLLILLSLYVFINAFCMLQQYQTTYKKVYFD